MRRAQVGAGHVFDEGVVLLGRCQAVLQRAELRRGRQVVDLSLDRLSRMPLRNTPGSLSMLASALVPLDMTRNMPGAAGWMLSIHGTCAWAPSARIWLEASGRGLHGHRRYRPCTVAVTMKLMTPEEQEAGGSDLQTGVLQPVPSRAHRRRAPSPGPGDSSPAGTLWHALRGTRASSQHRRAQGEGRGSVRAAGRPVDRRTASRGGGAEPLRGRGRLPALHPLRGRLLWPDRLRRRHGGRWLLFDVSARTSSACCRPGGAP